MFRCHVCGARKFLDIKFGILTYLYNVAPGVALRYLCLQGMSSDQEKILLLQKEFHLSQLRLKECGVELQKIRARVLQDLLDLEIYQHASERKDYDLKMAQLKVGRNYRLVYIISSRFKESIRNIFEI